MIRQLLRTTAAVALMALSASAADAQTYSFINSVGTQPFNVGTITLTNVGAGATASVNVVVDLLPGYGFLNTGGKTPFAFTLSGSEAGLTGTFSQPLNGTFPAGQLSLVATDGSNTPFGTYGVSVLSSAGNGSTNAYYGDLAFNVTRTGGLTADAFVANNDGYYFSADLTDGQSTGAQAWADRTGGGGTGSVVPEPSTYVLLGSGLLGLVGIASRRRRNV